MSLRDRLRRRPARSEAREREFEVLTLNHLSDFMSYKTRPEWLEQAADTSGRVKLIPADYPLNSEPASLLLSAQADLKREQRVNIEVRTPSGHLCTVAYIWEGEPEQARLSHYSVYDVQDEQALSFKEGHGRTPELSDLENMIRERLYDERAAYLESHPGERPALGPLDIAVTTAVVGQPAEPDISR